MARINEDSTEEFWTTKGLGQRCVLSPLLFSIYIASLESDFCKRNVGGVKVNGVRLWSLAYANDIVFFGEESRGYVGYDVHVEEIL